MSITVNPDVSIIEEDVVFAEVFGLRLLARLYRPRASGLFPALVEVHGGAWTSGDRLRNAALVAELGRSGILVMSIDFRMPPVAPYPASLADINLAIRWLKSHATALQVDPDMVGGFGTSSGGHQIVLTALRPRHADYAVHPLPGGNSVDAGLAFAIACWPILDPPQRYAMAKVKGRQNLIDGHNAFWVSEAAMAEGSPQRIVDAGEVGAMPPLLIIQGTLDDNVDHTTIDRFAEAYRKQGGAIDFYKYDEPHAFIGNDLSGGNAKHAVTLLKEFIRCHGTRKPAQAGRTDNV
jgi:acetyl esterase